MQSRARSTNRRACPGSAQRDFVLLASKCKKPDDMGVAKLLKPQADVISQITQFRETNRRSAQYNHLSTISESIAALSWVVTVSSGGFRGAGGRWMAGWWRRRQHKVRSGV